MLTNKFSFCFLAFLICFLGCKEAEVFSYQLTDEKLVEIISDLHLSESATQHLFISHRDSMSKVYLTQVLEIHEVSKDIFESDYQTLKRDPEKLLIVYDQIIKRLNDLKLKKEQTEKPKGQESKKRTKKR